MSHTVYPQTVALPDGVQARVRIVHTVVTNDKGEQVLTQLVSSPPQYERRDGTTVALDVTIPDDLLAAGWAWHGSTLIDGPIVGGHIAITTCTYPPPGWPSARGSCFDCARRFEQLRAERHARRVAERVALATKAPKPKNDAPAPAAVQMELF